MEDKDSVLVPTKYIQLIQSVNFSNFSINIKIYLKNLSEIKKFDSLIFRLNPDPDF